jgi:uncharacterized protein YkwD
MEGSERRLLQLRAAVPTLALAGAIAVAGCGGGGRSTSAEPPAPVRQVSSEPGGAVTADRTRAFVGPTGRATSGTQQFEDRARKISAKANHEPNAQKKNGVDGAAACNDSGITPRDGNQDQLSAAVLCLVNAERAALGLPGLNESPQLDEAAIGMAQRMVTEHFFSHNTPDGKNVVERIEPTGYIPNSSDWVVGENLAWGSGALSTPQAIVNGWMNSPGHKANILAPDYKDIGLAAAMGAPSTSVTGGTVYVNDFGATSGADLGAKLPPESGSSGTAGAAATVAGTKVAAKAKKANGKKRTSKHKRHHGRRRSR